MEPAATHVHDAADITTGVLADARLPERLGPFAKTITDWNLAVQNGCYMGFNILNQPEPGNSWFMGFVEAHNNQYATQTVHQFTADGSSDTRMWRRSLNAGTWSAWYRLRVSEAELDTRYMKAGAFLNVKDFGAKGDYSTNDSASINTAIAAAAPVGATVFFPAGTYTCENIVVPPFVRLVGDGGNYSRFTHDNGYIAGRRAGVALRRVPGSINPLLVQAGEGSWVENFELQGTNSTATIFVHSGFQTTVKSITAVGGAGIGIDVQRANNSRWYDIEVQNCGSASVPGMKIWSKDKATLPYPCTNETNTLDIYGLTIERCANVHLDIAWEPTGATGNAEYWAEFVRIHNLHVESSRENSGTGAGVGNVDAAIRLGGVRSVHFTSPFIYAGPGPAIQHSQQYVRSYLNGGVKLVNGTVIGSDTAGVAATGTLVVLTKGDDFSADACRFARATNAVSVATDYGRVSLGITNLMDGTITPLADSRAAKTLQTIHGDVAITGVPTTNTAQGEAGNALVRRDAVNALLQPRLAPTAATVTDWNVALANGWYMGQNAANQPEAGNFWFIGYAEVHNHLYATQTIHRFVGDTSTDTLMFRRSMDAGTWSAWYRLRISEAEQDARYVQKTRTPAIKTGNYAMLPADDIIFANATSGITISLPNPSTAVIGKEYVIKNINTGTATVNSAGTTKTIDGAASHALPQWAKGRYLTNGTQWYTV